MPATVLPHPASHPTPRFWYRCRACGHSRATSWRRWPTRETTLTTAACGSCDSSRITVYELATRATVHLPRPLIPPPIHYRCGDCGAGGLTSHGHTCPACLGAGFL